MVEHTSINPNKAAHIGHVRNAVLGDTFVRILKAAGDRVEVQNYIDNTGVQVADVVVGFMHLEKMDLDEIKALDASLPP
jgi:arginyl-tRNA synthetase